MGLNLKSLIAKLNDTTRGAMEAAAGSICAGGAIAVFGYGKIGFAEVAGDCHDAI